MFTFYRLVVDEYTYLTKVMEDIVALLRALNRWILSGTPTLMSFTALKRMGLLIGVNLGIDDYASMHKDDLFKAMSEMTTVETFLSYLENHSFAWLLRRHDVCQKFLDQFARRDEMDVSGILLQEYYRLVQHSLFEFAMYQEFQQRLALMNFDSSLRPRLANNDSHKLYKLAVDKCKDLREGLLLLATHARPFEHEGEEKDVITACARIYEIRKWEAGQMRDKISKKLRKAVWLERNQEEGVVCTKFKDFQDMVDINYYGDKECMDTLNELIKEAKKGYKYEDWKEFFRDDDGEVLVKGLTAEEMDDMPMRPSGQVEFGNNKHLSQSELALRLTSIELNRLCELYVDHIRSFRFLGAIQNVRTMANTCSSCQTKNLDKNKFTLLTRCGHVVCNTPCSVDQEGNCPVCYSLNQQYQKLAGSHLYSKTDRSAITKYGQKICDLVTLIKSFPEDDKVVLFVQFPNILEKVLGALEESGIDFMDLTSTGDPSRKLMCFQKNEGVKKGTPGAKVLVLNIGDATASGSNLTIANRVIFVSPYYLRGYGSQTQWEATMKQAIGRVRRWGQKKTVHCYYFVTTETIDVDITEKRTKKRLVSKTIEGKTGFWGVLQDRVVDEDQDEDNLPKTPFSSSISHIVFKKHDEED
ncbi:hypothetical protein G7Y89_g15204 [Cudoniella acicularis]|uniref:Helicase C-terminal domain-containing protein n=1 Tax=Cudoniella acicularis TaxID=354080 RepID=A0A8H4QRT7_9HELO|nr:hypothetical protein G7Y89_g15204 [Cudoniella acicularis]